MLCRRLIILSIFSPEFLWPGVFDEVFFLSCFRELITINQMKDKNNSNNKMPRQNLQVKFMDRKNIHKQINTRIPFFLNWYLKWKETERNCSEVLGSHVNYATKRKKTLTLLLACTSRLSDRIKSYFHHHPANRQRLCEAVCVRVHAVSVCFCYVAMLSAMCWTCRSVACFSVCFVCCSQHQQTSSIAIYRCAVYTAHLVEWCSFDRLIGRSSESVAHTYTPPTPVQTSQFGLHIYMCVCMMCVSFL